MSIQEPLIKNSIIVVHHCRLRSDGVFGWQEVNDDEFLIHIERDLCKKDYILTLIHELVHCRQTLECNFNYNSREEEAYRLEILYYNIFNHEH